MIRNGSRWPRALLALAGLLLGMQSSGAWATHFRAAYLTWEKTGTNQATFHLVVALRRDGYAGTANDGHPAVGDIVQEDIGTDTVFVFGDGGGTTSTLNFKVRAVNRADNFLIGEALDPATNGALVHQYPSAGPFTAGFSSCCTIHDQRNNRDGYYSNVTTVNFVAVNHTPESSLAPIIDVGASGLQTFSVPAFDRAGFPLTWRLATPTEACGGNCTNANPPNLSINSATGLVSWSTTPEDLGLWQAAVVVESHAGNGAVVGTAQVNFLIRVSDIQNPPFWVNPPTPANGSVLTICPNEKLSVHLRADENREGAVLHIDNLGLPQGAAFIPVDGKPASATFNWTPTRWRNGSYLVTFTAQDERQPPGSAQPRTFRINVGGGGCPPDQAPVWVSPPTPSDGQVFTTQSGKPISFSLRASDPDALDLVRILPASFLPAGSVLSTADGNPANATFTWIPGFAQTLSVSFTGKDGELTTGPRTFVLQVDKRDTNMVADAVIAVQATPLKVQLSPVAYLSAVNPKQPLAGRKVAFRINGGATTLCTGVTNAQGAASCSSIVNDVQEILNLGYTATFAGDAGYNGSSAHGAIVRVGGTVP